MSVLTVGFDLDMTLVDSRPGIAATYRVLSQRTGVAIDTDLVVSRLGPPLVHEMAHWFPAEQVAEAVEEYRALYSDHAIAPADRCPERSTRWPRSARQGVGSSWSPAS